jgi:hypothetical protein
MVNCEDPDWEAYGMECWTDRPVWGVVALVRSMWDAGHQVVLVSARTSAAADLTIGWLDKHRIPYTALILKDKEDVREHVVYKVETILDVCNKYGGVIFHVDDWPEVRDALAPEGISCLVVSPPARSIQMETTH